MSNGMTKTSSAIDWEQMPTPDDAADFPLTDSGNAEAFAADNIDQVRYDCARKTWYHFDEQRWLPNNTGEVDRLALATIRRRQDRVARIADDGRRKRALKWTIGSENRPRRENLLALAAKLKSLAVAGDDWDARPLLFCVENGVIDLERGQLRHGTPEDRLTKSAPIAFDPMARCDRFEQFLAEIFAGRPELVDYIQRVVGYCLTGLTVEQIFWILYGLGANGKSTLLELLFRYIFGGSDYAWAMPFPAAGWSNTMSEYQKASLVGRRLVTASEVTRRGHLNEELVKSLTGDDTLNARHPYGRPFQFVPVAKFSLRVNDRPIIRDESHGMWRRVKLVEFRERFPVNSALPDELRTEAPGILNWGLRGCADWQREGLCEPSCVQAATADYRRESDPLVEFLADRCDVQERARIGGRELFSAYRGWCDARQAPADDRLSQTAFGKRTKERFPNVGTSRKTVYSGIGLQSAQTLDFSAESER